MSAGLTLSLRVPAGPSYLPTAVGFGRGCASRVGAEVRRLRPDGVGRLVVVTGTSSGWDPTVAAVTAGLRREHGDACRVVRMRGVSASLPDVARVLDEVRHGEPDIVVAVGGGRVLDAAKTAALLAQRVGTLSDALDRVPDGPAVPLVALPTTAGSGAEVTPTATLWDLAGGRKLTLEHPAMFPAVALVDPDLVDGLPLRPLVVSALDALAHGSESAWSVRSTDESTVLALRAVRLVTTGLRALFRGEDTPATRSLLSLGSLCAGMAIAATRTTLAHALSYPLTARYGLVHGHACAATLGRVMAFNAGVVDEDCRDPRGPDHVRGAVASVVDASGARDLPEAVADLHRLLSRVGLPTIAECPDVDIDRVVAEAIGQPRSDNNPRRADPASLAELLRGAATR